VLAGADAWYPSDLVGDHGFMGSLSRAWVFFRESLAMAGRSPHLFAPATLASVANLALMGILVAALYLTGALESLLSAGVRSNPLLYVLVFVVAVVFHVVTFTLNSMAVSLVHAFLRGQDAGLGRAWRGLRDNLGVVLWLAAVGDMVNTMRGTKRSRHGSQVADLVGDGVLASWPTATWLMLPAIMLEGVPYQDAARRAVNLQSNSMARLAIGEVGITLLHQVAYLALALLGIVPVAIAYAIGGAGTGYYLALGWMTLVATAGYPVLMYTRIAFFTCVYLWARATEESRPETPPPAPLAKALGVG